VVVEFRTGNGLKVKYRYNRFFDEQEANEFTHDMDYRFRKSGVEVIGRWWSSERSCGIGCGSDTPQRGR